MKNNVKHIIALLLVLVVSFQMTGVVMAEEADLTEDAAMEESVYVPRNLRLFRILNALELFTIYKEENFTGNAEVSRAETAAIAAAMVGLSDGYSMEGQQMPFSDVNATDIYAYEINTVATLGIMNGCDEGIFNPNASVTEEQFIKVIVETLGYGAEAQAVGGYPYGYTAVAGKYRLLDNVDFKGTIPITQDVAVQIVYNCLTVGMPRVISVENGGYRTKSDQTLLEQHDIVKKTGIIMKTTSAFLGIGEPAHNGMVQIGNENYDAGKSGCEEYLGYRVEYYYKDVVGDSYGTVLYAEPKGNEAVTIEAEDIISFSNSQYRYYSDNREEDSDVPSDAYILFNGVLAENGFNQYIPKIGSVSLIDNDRDGSVDVVSITSYDVYYVGSNNTASYTIICKDNKEIRGYDKAIWNVTDEAGKIIPAVNITKDMLFVLAVSEDQSVVKGFKVTDKVEGTLEGYYTEGEEKGVTINGVDYKVHPYCEELIGSTIQVSDRVAFYVYDGMLLVKTLPSSSLTANVGYLIEIGHTQGLNAKIKLRMLLQTGEVKVVDASQKAKLVCYGRGEIKMEDYKEVEAVLKHEFAKYNEGDSDTVPTGGTDIVVHQPVLYKLDEQGEISYLEIAPGHNVEDRVDIASDTDGFQLVEFIRYQWTRLFAPVRNIDLDRVLLDPNTYFIDVPNDMDNYDAYKILPLSATAYQGDPDTRKNPFRLYRTGNDIMGANIVVCSGIFSSSGGGAALVVDRITESVTEDGSPCYAISGMSTGLTNVTVLTKDKEVLDNHKTPTIDVGDVISASNNSFGYVESITVIYDVASDTLAAKESDSDPLHNSYYAGGQVFKKNSEGIIAVYKYGDIAESEAKEPGSVSFNTLMYLDAASYPGIYFFDTTSTSKTRSHLMPASWGDIKAYLDDPENASSIFAARYSGSARLLIIYK